MMVLGASRYIFPPSCDHRGEAYPGNREKTEKGPGLEKGVQPVVEGVRMRGTERCHAIGPERDLNRAEVVQSTTKCRANKENDLGKCIDARKVRAVDGPVAGHPCLFSSKTAETCAARTLDSRVRSSIRCTSPSILSAQSSPCLVRSPNLSRPSFACVLPYFYRPRHESASFQLPSPEGRLSLERTTW